MTHNLEKNPLIDVIEYMPDGHGAGLRAAYLYAVLDPGGISDRSIASEDSEWSFNVAKFQGYIPLLRQVAEHDLGSHAAELVRVIEVCLREAQEAVSEPCPVWVRDPQGALDFGFDWDPSFRVIWGDSGEKGFDWMLAYDAFHFGKTQTQITKDRNTGRTRGEKLALRLAEEWHRKYGTPVPPELSWPQFYDDLIHRHLKVFVDRHKDRLPAELVEPALYEAFDLQKAGEKEAFSAPPRGPRVHMLTQAEKEEVEEFWKSVQPLIKPYANRIRYKFDREQAIAQAGFEIANNWRIIKDKQNPQAYAVRTGYHAIIDFLRGPGKEACDWKRLVRLSGLGSEEAEEQGTGTDLAAAWQAGTPLVPPLTPGGPNTPKKKT